MPRKLVIGPGGVAAEMGMIDPRTAKRTRIESVAQGATRPGSDSTLEHPPVGAPTGRRPRHGPEDEEDDDSFLRRTIVLLPLPGRRGNRRGKVRWYHRVGADRECWAFSTSKTTWEAFRDGAPLTAKGAVYPDGKPVVPPGVRPTDVVIRCGSCGSHTIDFLQLRFYQE